MKHDSFYEHLILLAHNMLINLFSETSWLINSNFLSLNIREMRISAPGKAGQWTEKCKCIVASDLNLSQMWQGIYRDKYFDKINNFICNSINFWKNLLVPVNLKSDKIYYKHNFTLIISLFVFFLIVLLAHRYVTSIIN